MSTILETVNASSTSRKWKTKGKILIGRGKHLNESIYKLLTNRFVALIGESGSGKSTLLNEGIVEAISGNLDPKFIKYNKDKDATWYIAQMRPGHSPFDNLALALSNALVVAGNGSKERRKGGQHEQELIENQLKSSYSGLTDLYHKYTKQVKQRQLNLLIAIDQFEDIFRYQHLMEDERRASVVDFINNIIHAVNDSAVSIYVAIAIQSEYLGQSAGIQGFSQTIYQGQYFVPPLKFEDVKNIYRYKIDSFFTEKSRKIKRENIEDFLELEQEKDQIKERILSQLKTFADYSRFKDSTFLYLSNYALNYSLDSWENKIQEIEKPEDLKLLLEIFKSKATSISQEKYRQQNVFDTDERNLNNFVDQHLWELYTYWSIKLGDDKISTSQIIDDWELEWKLIEIDNVDDKDKVENWNISNTRAPEIVMQTATIAEFIEEVTEQENAEDLEQNRTGFNTNAKSVTNTLEKIKNYSDQLLGLGHNDSRNKLINEFEQNIYRIVNAINKIDKDHIKKINDKLIRIESVQQNYFQIVMKALTTKERTGLEVRYPIKVKDLLDNVPLPVDKNLEVIQLQKERFHKVVKEILYKLEVARIIDVIPLTPIPITDSDRHKNRNYDPEDVIDIQSDAYVSVSQGILQDWIREESKSSGNYLQLARVADSYFKIDQRKDISRELKEREKTTLLLDDYKLGLNLHWRKTQYPSNGWALRYDTELVDLNTSKEENNITHISKSKFLSNGLLFLRVSQDHFYEKQKIKQEKADKARKNRKIIAAIIGVLSIAAVIFAFTSQRQSAKANNRLFEANAINLLEHLHYAGFISSDTIYHQKMVLKKRIEENRKKIKEGDQARFLIKFLNRQNIISVDALSQNGTDYQAILAMVNSHIAEPEIFKETFGTFLSNIKTKFFNIENKQCNIKNLDSKINQNYTYHALNMHYEDILHAQNSLNTINQMNYVRSIFALASSPDEDTAFAFGDNEGNVLICHKEGDRIEVTDSINIDKEASTIITAINFHNKKLMVGNEEGTVVIYDLDRDSYRVPLKDQFLSKQISTNQSIDQILAYSQNGEDYIFIRVSNRIFITSTNKKNILRVGAVANEIIGEHLIDNKLVIVTDKGLIHYSINDIIDKYNRSNRNLDFFTSNTKITPLTLKTDTLQITKSEVSSAAPIIALSDTEENIYLVKIEENGGTDVRLFRTQPHNMQIEDISFHPSSNQFATVSLDGTAKIYADVNEVFDKASYIPNVNSDIKVRGNGSPMYYLEYNNDDELITTMDIALRVWVPSVCTLLEQFE